MDFLLRRFLVLTLSCRSSQKEYFASDSACTFPTHLNSKCASSSIFGHLYIFMDDHPMFFPWQIHLSCAWGFPCCNTNSWSSLSVWINKTFTLMHVAMEFIYALWKACMHRFVLRHACTCYCAFAQDSWEHIPQASQWIGYVVRSWCHIHMPKLLDTCVETLFDTTLQKL